jgi:alkylated DNA repair dioxygenase AlkB
MVSRTAEQTRGAKRQSENTDDMVRLTSRRTMPLPPPGLWQCFHKSFLQGDLLESTWKWLQTQEPYIVRYNEAWKSPVKSRPKVNWGIKNSDGYWPLYKWGQIKLDYGKIADMPSQIQAVASLIEDRFGHPTGYLNQALATFYWNGKDQHIPAHQDKVVSAESDSKVEDKTPIYNLSFGAVRPFLICDLECMGTADRSKLGVLQEFPMHPGDMFVLTPEVNAKYSHCVPKDRAVTQLRISLVFRHVTKHWVKEVDADVYEYYSIEGDKTGEVKRIRTPSAGVGGNTPALRGEETHPIEVQVDGIGPAGPDGKQLFARLPEFVAVYLVFASDTLVRVGKLEKHVFEHYLTELHRLNPTMAKAYIETQHCSVSFLMDTTTLKLLKSCLCVGAEGDKCVITENALYNIAIGQSVLPSWRSMEKLGPFDVKDPPSPEVFAERFRCEYPDTKAVVPSHLKQGMLGLLGKGKEVDTSGRFVHELAAKVPAALDRITRGDDALLVLQEALGLPKFRALLVARLLSVADPSLYDFNRRDIGDFAELGLWIVEGMPVGEARAAVSDGWTKPTVDPLFAKLVEVLPAAIAGKDEHGVIELLKDMNIVPLCAQNVEHMLCEFRKMAIPEGRAASGERYEGYAELWRQCEPILARRAA